MHTLDDLRAGRLRGITRLNLCQELTDFPREIFDLADSLEVLDLTGNRLSDLPADLHRLTRLKVLFCSNNRFTHLPHAIGRCQVLETAGFRGNRITRVDAQALPPSLRSLVLTDNALEQLPEALGDCAQLQKLMLAGNRLRGLPQSLARCERLELLRIASNRLQALPDWLLRMPRLAWLAYADNPLPPGLVAPAADGHCPVLHWQDIDLGQELGRGASGVIHRAHLRDQDAPVAVKLYKGAITSDGSPLAEMSACIAAGDHPQLVRLAGRIDDHPQQLPALVMQLIDAHWSNLAGPPSLDSCTRDRYPDNRPLTLPALRRLVGGIASVCAHLHERGLSHGDLYAHNILFDDDGQCLLGDFGAASFHPQDGGAQAQALERLEVRAFGILLEELLQQCAAQEHVLLALALSCQQADVMARPSFASLEAQLRG
ncbi:protein kinase [Pseudomonas sp. 250J]|uniref:Leucine-rich repeat-containing serine/threonine-protein kinase n=1 Tax=Pseudomonas peradeniyensis TaxID=2745488 RepID=A0ABT2VH09_9PSED|nr:MULTISPECIES: leucine-rich repeat-containing protein kinase family protein [Pseudomonas]KNX78568.1 protein kinase [Pseudomonas sp. 250J]MCU7241026.1 leucine-rich repeat-containing serine/threonine-protein kinase [Pseudomonas peradeniyensis]MCU7282263.1 leucine-rich repeat-containing serine/threonine-protein kinase [Pseudomonas peradeniyensis]QZA52820.1 leucine-rich repeat-containing serine/threonine-protein kinase [Pseudomonas sp. 2hn]